MRHNNYAGRGNFCCKYPGPREVPLRHMNNFNLTSLSLGVTLSHVTFKLRFEKYPTNCFKYVTNHIAEENHMDGLKDVRKG